MVPKHIQSKARKLYKGSLSFRGPYLRPDGRKFISIKYFSGKTSTTLLSRFKMTVALGRLLSDSEEVDHKDDDKTNDKLTNLQLLPKSVNAAKAVYAIHGLPKKVSCKNCEVSWKVSASRLGKVKFCSNSCRSLFLGANQFGNKLKGYDKTKGKTRKASVAKLVETQRA